MEYVSFRLNNRRICDTIYRLTPLLTRGFCNIVFENITKLIRYKSKGNNAVKLFKLSTGYFWLILKLSYTNNIVAFDEVERKPNHVLTCDFAEFVPLCKVIFWKTHIPVRTPKWPPSLIFTGACHGQ